MYKTSVIMIKMYKSITFILLIRMSNESKQFFTYMKKN